MAISTKLAETKIITADGVVTAFVYDRIAPDHIAAMLLRGAGAARYSRSDDDTDIVPRSIKSLLVFPISESTS